MKHIKLRMEGNQWSGLVKNKSDENCDTCQSLIEVAPSGLICRAEHTAEEVAQRELVAADDKIKFVQLLNLVSYIDGDREDSELDAAMFWSKTNICEVQDPVAGGCVTLNGLYFGTSDSHEPKFCPAHYFGDLGYKIVPKN